VCICHSQDSSVYSNILLCNSHSYFLLLACLLAYFCNSADTLYKVSLVGDDDSASRSDTPPESPSKQPLSNKSFASWGTNLLRGKKESSSSAVPLMSSTGPVKLTTSFEADQSAKSSGSNPDNADDDIIKNEESGKRPDDASETKNQNEKEKSESTEAKMTHPSTNPFENQIAIVASTLGMCV
jgi:hypothetical protein